MYKLHKNKENQFSISLDIFQFHLIRQHLYDQKKIIRNHIINGHLIGVCMLHAHQLWGTWGQIFLSGKLWNGLLIYRLWTRIDPFSTVHGYWISDYFPSEGRPLQITPSVLKSYLLSVHLMNRPQYRKAFLYLGLRKSRRETVHFTGQALENPDILHWASATMLVFNCVHVPLPLGRTLGRQQDDRYISMWWFACSVEQRNYVCGIECQCFVDCEQMLFWPCYGN